MNPRTHFCCKQIHILNDSVAADVSVINATAYSMLGVTTAAIPEAVAADDTVATATSANLSTAEAVAADLCVPVNTAASSSAGKAIAEAVAAAVKGVSVMCFFCMNSYLICLHSLIESTCLFFKQIHVLNEFVYLAHAHCESGRYC
jgi:hypothetical protein